MPSRRHKIVLTAFVLGATAAVAGTGVFAAFTAQTTNTGNSISSGTVDITNNGGSLALYTLPNQGPGSSTQRCIEVTYTGTLASNVKLFRPTTITNGGAFNLTIERGTGLTGSMPACTGFTTAGTIYTGTLGGLGNTYATGVDARGGAAWAQGDKVDYRFTISVVDDPTVGAHTAQQATGTHSFTWEAHNN